MVKDQIFSCGHFQQIEDHLVVKIAAVAAGVQDAAAVDQHDLTWFRCHHLDGNGVCLCTDKGFPKDLDGATLAIMLLLPE